MAKSMPGQITKFLKNIWAHAPKKIRVSLISFVDKEHFHSIMPYSGGERVILGCSHNYRAKLQACSFASN